MDFIDQTVIQLSEDVSRAAGNDAALRLYRLPRGVRQRPRFGILTV